ncbi:MAG: ABC transporter permease, partial [Bacteroidales bacterium]|nr:ABC transporter permease [Bacteroidales bacterium]
MLRFLIRRILYGFLVLLGVTTLVFLLFNILPGDPARMMMGQRADLSSVETVRHELGLDRPAWTQFAGFINDLSPISLHKEARPQSFFFLNPEKYEPY